MKRSKYIVSEQLLERSKKVLAGGVSSEFRKYNHPHAIFYTSGNGSHIRDVDGNEYLDFTLSQGPLILGHSHPSVLKAVNDYSQSGQLFAGQHIQEIELAEKLNELIPSAELIRFSLDGSEAVHTALRLARAKTGKEKFLRFEGHYHGWLDNVAWGISSPNTAAMGSKDEPVVNAWSAGLPSTAREEFFVLPWNDLDLVERHLSKHHSEIAAIITEPVMCNNGCIPPRPGFLEGLRAKCDQYNITLIFDEVITGFRLGFGGAQKHFNVIPDLSIFAKAMGSGYPISAIVGKRKWMELIESGKVIHAGTMNSCNPTVAAALATIRVLEQEQPYARLFNYGLKLMHGLREAAGKTKYGFLVQGPGPMFHVAFTSLSSINDYRDTLATNASLLKKFIARMHDNNIRIIGRGLWYISAAHTERDIDHAIDVAREVLKEMELE